MHGSLSFHAGRLLRPQRCHVESRQDPDRHGGDVPSGRTDPEVIESLAIAQDTGAGDVRIVLFVRLRDGARLDEALQTAIRDRLRAHASVHHVPQRIVQVTDLPRTINGKISELAVRAVVHGQPVRNVEALANPEALEQFSDIPELRISV